MKILFVIGLASATRYLAGEPCPAPIPAGSTCDPGINVPGTPATPADPATPATPADPASKPTPALKKDA